MSPHLRDWFAAHIAASLAAEQRLGLETIAARAYDVADALMAERDRRFEAELAEGMFDDETDPRSRSVEYETDPRSRSVDAGERRDVPHLLDDAMPYEEKDDDAFVREAEERASFLPPANDRPGLARTQLELPLELRLRKMSS